MQKLSDICTLVTQLLSLSFTHYFDIYSYVIKSVMTTDVLTFVGICNVIL